MTILKYGLKLRLALFLISTSLSSLQYIFQAFIIGNFITAATNADLDFCEKCYFCCCWYTSIWNRYAD